MHLYIVTIYIPVCIYIYVYLYIRINIDVCVCMYTYKNIYHLETQLICVFGHQPSKIWLLVFMNFTPIPGGGDVVWQISFFEQRKTTTSQKSPSICQDPCLLNQLQSLNPVLKNATPKKKHVFLCLIQRRGGSKEIEAGNLKFLPSLREASSEQEEPEPSQWLGDLRNFWEVFVSQVTGVDVIFFIGTPWKINRWFPQQWRFGSDQPSDFCWCISICVVV